MSFKKHYVFDLDNNVLEIDSVMYFEELQDDGTRKKVTITPEEFKKINGQQWPTEEFKYKFVDGVYKKSFKNFIETSALIMGSKEALATNNLGPAFPRLEKAIREASVWSICTSRAHLRSAIISLKKMLVDHVGIEVQSSFLKNFNKRQWRHFDFDQAVEIYVQEMIDYCVTSNEFQEELTEWKYVWTIRGKAIAMSDYLQRAVQRSKNDLISVWFSDDDSRLIKSVEEVFVEYKDKPEYSNVHLVTYYTNDANNIIKNSITNKQEIISNAKKSA